MVWGFWGAGGRLELGLGLGLALALALPLDPSRSRGWVATSLPSSDR